MYLIILSISILDWLQINVYLSSCIQKKENVIFVMLYLAGTFLLWFYVLSQLVTTVYLHHLQIITPAFIDYWTSVYSCQLQLSDHFSVIICRKVSFHICNPLRQSSASILSCNPVPTSSLHSQKYLASFKRTVQFYFLACFYFHALVLTVPVVPRHRLDEIIAPSASDSVWFCMFLLNTVYGS